jgi:glutamate 5-kinase
MAYYKHFMIPKLIAGARKIVFKFGSNTLADKEGKINFHLMTEMADQTASLIKK